MTSQQPLARWAWVVPAVPALAMTLLLTLEGARMLPVALPGTDPAAWWYPAPGNSLFAVGFLVFWALTLWSLRSALPHRGRRAPSWISATAVLTLLLGGVSYAPCTAGSSVMAYLSWVLGLFGGQVEDTVIGPDAAICTGPYPLALQVARLLGLGTLFIGALTTLAALSARQSDRWRLRWAHDLDLVVGVTEATLALVRALVDERRRLPRRAEWFRATWPERLRSLTPRGSGVAVLHPNADDPRLGEAREAGAIIAIGDPADPVLLRDALLSPRGHVGVRRLFAVGPSQQVNIEVVEAAQQVLAGRVAGGADWVASEVVPRLVAGFDDPREARDWRLAHLDTPGCFVDALTVDGRLARELVNRLAAERVGQLLLVGDSALTIAVLDEVALQRAFRHERATAAGLPPDWSLDEIQVVAPTADRVLGEWLRHRAPGAVHPPGLRVSAATDGWEVAADGLAPDAGPAAAIVTGPPSPEVLAQAMRVARMHPRLLVFCPDVAAQGVVAAGIAGHNPVRYGPTFLQAGGVPEDSWTVLARQQHETYRAQDTSPLDGRAARRPWGQPTDAPGDRLPEFFREDNLRQQRHVLQLVRDWDGPWVPVTSPDAADWLGRPGALAIATEIARREHERWCLLRERHGWRCPGTESPVGETPGQRKLRWERMRLNSNLIDWETGQPRGGASTRPKGEAGAAAEALRRGNVEAVARIVCRLYALGLIPERSTTAGAVFGRTGEVRAIRLDQDRSWTTTTGSVMRGHAGDWLVTGTDGVLRTVAAVEFAQLYRLVAGDRYRRVGTVTARQAVAREAVATLEGEAVAEPGDWVVTDPRGNSWPVPDAEFRTSYRREDSQA